MDKIIAVDRDGTLIRDPGYFGKEDSWKDDMYIFPDVAEGLAGMEGRIIVTTNQAGVARGYYDERRVKEIHAAIEASIGMKFDGLYYSCHVNDAYLRERGISPEEITDGYYVDDGCAEGLYLVQRRKPGIIMIEEARKAFGFENPEIVVIGDSVHDAFLGVNAGGSSIILMRGGDYEKMLSERIIEQDEYDKLIEKMNGVFDELKGNEKVEFASDLIEAAGMIK